MNIALITAGGVGERSKADVPKQFLFINDIPLIIYTLKAFQMSPYIDAIAVVCLNGWQLALQGYAEKEGITKLKWIFKGGKTVQDSWRNGITELMKRDDVDYLGTNIICHDGVRPLVSQRIIEECVRKCDQYGFAVTVNKVPEVVMSFDETYKTSSNILIDRKYLVTRQNPQAFKLSVLYTKYKNLTNVIGKIDPYEVVCDGELPMANCVFSDIFNFKITYPEDIEMFKTIINAQ